MLSKLSKALFSTKQTNDLRMWSEVAPGAPARWYVKQIDRSEEHE